MTRKGYQKGIPYAIKGETIVELKNGWSLRSGGEQYKAGAYVRLCNALGAEMLYWDKEEWQTDPESVMGAIMRAASGDSELVKEAAKVREDYRSPTRLVLNKKKGA